MPLDKFEKLEEGLGRLLSGYEVLRGENNGLKEALEARERELGELRERLRKMDREKALVKDKVDALLGKIEGITQSA